jgi:hypothetical protein
MILTFAVYRTEARRNALLFLFGYGISHVIRRWVGFFLEYGKVALQLFAQDVEQGRRGSGGGRKRDCENS